VSRPAARLASVALAATIAGAALPAAAYVDPSRAQADVDAAMRDGSYPFCKAPREPLSRDAMALCAHAASISGCDGFARACAARREPRRWSLDLPEWLGHAVGRLVGAVAWLVAWVLLPGIGVALLATVVRALLRRQSETFDSPALEPPEVGPGAPAIERHSDENALLAQADEQARQHAYERALELYLAASLVSLDRRGALHLSRDRTNGEYVRGCTEPGAKPALRGLAADVDRVKFGGQAATEETALCAGAAARSIVRGLAASVAALALLFCTGCGADGLPGVPRRGDDPAGKELLVDLLHRQGFRVEPLGGALSSLPLPEAGARSPAVLVDLERTEVDEDTAKHLAEWVAAGGSLVLAGDAEAWPKELGITALFSTDALGLEARRLLTRGGAGPSDYDEDDEDEDDAPVTPSGPTYATRTEVGELAQGGGLRGGPESERIAWLDDGTTYAVAVPHGQGWVTGIATSELLTNAALARPGNAAAALAILSNADREELKIADAEDGVSPPSSPLAAIERAGLTLGLVHALAATLLLFLASGVRLSRPSPEAPAARRAFVEHVEAVGELYRRGGHAAHALSAFARFADHRLRARMPRGSTDVPSMLAARARVPLEVCQRIWTRAMGADPASPVGDELGILKELTAVYSRAVDQER
jgi:hypothetical protein